MTGVAHSSLACLHSSLPPPLLACGRLINSLYHEQHNTHWISTTIESTSYLHVSTQLINKASLQPQHKKMVYPCNPISYERHPIIIFEEWETMGMFDDIFESDPSITCADSNTSSDRNSIISYISTTPDEVAARQFDQSLSTVSTISSPPSSGESLNITLSDPLPSTPKAGLKVQSPSSSQDDKEKHLESASFSKAEENKKEKGLSTSKKPTEVTPISHTNTHERNKGIKKRRVSYVSKAA